MPGFASLGKVRLRAVWLIVLPFFWFAEPTPFLLLVGGTLTLVGIGIRAWSAGTIHKNEELTTSGPYAFTRNPLYLGSFLVGVGVSISGGHWIWPAIFVAFYAVVYSRTIAREARHLRGLFPELYADYAAAVPVFLPRSSPYRPAAPHRTATGFRWSQYRRNKEWEAALGALAAFGLLAAKTIWP